VLHFGYHSLLDVVFVFAVAVFFGWVLLRTRSIVGVTLSHGLTKIRLFLVFPLLLAQTPPPAFAPPPATQIMPTPGETPAEP
jgi:membrane protease YdiL (CAAX protease family)